MAISKTSRDVLAGTAGGVTQVLVGQPFDIVKVRLQTSTSKTGIQEIASAIFKERGLVGFYSGTLTPLVGVGACVSIQFGVVGAVKRFFARRNAQNGAFQPDRLDNAQLYLAGAAAGIANSVVAAPVEQIRIRLQTQSNNKDKMKGPLDCATRIVKTGGFSSIFRGITPTIIREGHGLGIYFLTYEYLVKRQLERTGKSRAELSNTMSMLFGGTAGITLWLAAYPIDVVKSKMQTDAMSPGKRLYPTTLACVRNIHAKSGIRGFFHGLTPTLIRAPFANAATFVAYEAASRHLSQFT